MTNEWYVEERIKQAPLKVDLIYLAAPWFNDDQMARMQRVLAMLHEWRNLGPKDRKIFSPYEEFVCPPDASKEVRKSTYDGNIESIHKCGMIVAITDGKDMGTIYEVGYAACIRDTRKRDLPITSADFGYPVMVGCALDLPEGAKFNLMLAEGFDVICTGFKQLRDYLAAGIIPSYDTPIE